MANAKEIIIIVIYFKINICTVKPPKKREG